MSGCISLEPAFTKVACKNQRAERNSAATHGGIWTCEIVVMLIIDDFSCPEQGSELQDNMSGIGHKNNHLLLGRAY